MLLGTLLPLAAAATVTEIPPFLRGDVGVGYTYDRLAGSLEERDDDGDITVGERALQDHRLDYSLAFGVGPGVALAVSLPQWVSSAVSYDAQGKMIYDPATESGTYEDALAGTPGTASKGKGLGGVWIGVRGTPFSEAFEKRQNRVTWLLEGAVRTPDSTNFWTMADGQQRGAGPGGTAFKLHSAWSTTFGAGHPYIAATWVAEGARQVDLYAGDGTRIATGVTIDPANTVRLRVGTEVVAGENAASGGRTSFDLHLGVDYASYSQIPSGLFLPDVLEDGLDRPSQQAESLEPGAGLALHVRPMSYLQLDLAGDVAWHLPQRIEDPYQVYTGEDTLRAAVSAGFTVRIR